MTEPTCPICRAATAPAGVKRGFRTGREFALRRCGACGFGFVAEPWTDYAQIYDDAYYEGRGSDPWVDYVYEFEHPTRTVRRYEWRGIARAVAHLRAAPAKWLDYGCGNGGLVRQVRTEARYEIFGYDTGAWADRARASGLPILHEAELVRHEGTFDVVTAIEVIEHCVAPLDVLRQLRRLLKPGGLLFLTTANADTAPRDFPSWYYVSPEIHVSYFTARALSDALRQSGFEPFPRGIMPGWDDIVRFKILKKLRVRDANPWQRLLPWTLLARLADKKYGLSAHPLGRAI
ncbi:MAG: class I SAM-dependent methyltransferase [Opitutus sp.]|nr:class I SAM-dependent methyltransferase [Opitutus sp.]